MKTDSNKAQPIPEIGTLFKGQVKPLYSEEPKKNFKSMRTVGVKRVRVRSFKQEQKKCIIRHPLECHARLTFGCTLLKSDTKSKQRTIRSSNNEKKSDVWMQRLGEREVWTSLLQLFAYLISYHSLQGKVITMTRRGAEGKKDEDMLLVL